VAQGGKIYLHGLVLADEDERASERYKIVETPLTNSGLMTGPMPADYVLDTKTGKVQDVRARVSQILGPSWKADKIRSCLDGRRVGADCKSSADLSRDIVIPRLREDPKEGATLEEREAYWVAVLKNFGDQSWFEIDLTTGKFERVGWYRWWPYESRYFRAGREIVVQRPGSLPPRLKGQSYELRLPGPIERYDLKGTKIDDVDLFARVLGVAQDTGDLLVRVDPRIKAPSGSEGWPLLLLGPDLKEKGSFDDIGTYSGEPWSVSPRGKFIAWANRNIGPTTPKMFIISTAIGHAQAQIAYEWSSGFTILGVSDQGGVVCLNKDSDAPGRVETRGVSGAHSVLLKDVLAAAMDTDTLYYIQSAQPQILKAARLSDLKNAAPQPASVPASAPAAAE
jgi:hypothetical protein